MRVAFFPMLGAVFTMSIAALSGCAADPVYGDDPYADEADAAADDQLAKASRCDNRCSPSCPCLEGEGDCDSDSDCAGDLFCPPDGPGIERCARRSDSGSNQSCSGMCSPSCQCGEGQGDCDRNEDCAEGLVCPPDGEGVERCQKPTSSGGGSSGGSGTGGSGSGGSGTGVITHVGTTKVWDSNGQGVRVARPSGTQAGDLLVLFLHRTDDVLPLQVSGWKRVAECYKTDNGYQCATAADCSSWYNSSFCRYFGGSRTGRDLAQSVYVKAASSNEPSSYSFNFNMDSSGHPGWAMLTALRGADTTSPVRDWAHTGCDNHADSIFPSVYGQAGDMLLMSQSYDDAVSQSKFGAPSGASTFGYVSNSDEAGFLFGRRLSSSGETGRMATIGSGASSCKDALISLTIKPR